MKKQSLQIVLLCISFLYAPTLHGSLGRYLKDKAIALVMRQLPISYKIDYFLQQYEKAKLLESAKKGPIITEPDESPQDVSIRKQEPLLFPTATWQPHYSTIDVPTIIEKAKENSSGPLSITINLHHENNQHASVDTSNREERTRPGKAQMAWYLQASESLTTATRWARSHKWTVAGSCLAVAYVSMQAILIHLGWTLSKETMWSMWKKQCTLEELYRIPQQNLIHDLIATVQGPDEEKRFLTSSLKLCTKEIDQEISALKRYRSIVGLLDRYLFRKLFFYNERLVEESNDRIQRLLFIRGTVCAAMQNIPSQAYDKLFTQQHSSHQST